jgi:hypothetical protein
VKSSLVCERAETVGIRRVPEEFSHDRDSLSDGRSQLSENMKHFSCFLVELSPSGVVWRFDLQFAFN